MSSAMNTAQSRDSQPIVCHIFVDAPYRFGFEEECYRVTPASARRKGLEAWSGGI